MYILSVKLLSFDFRTVSIEVWTLAFICTFVVKQGPEFTVLDANESGNTSCLYQGRWKDFLVSSRY